MKWIFLAVTLTGSLGFAQDSSALKVKKSGRPPAANLKIKSSQVPQFEVYQKKVVNGKTEVFKVKNIPALDIGAERELSASDLAPFRLPEVRPLKLQAVRRYPLIPALDINLKFDIAAEPQLKKITTVENIKQIPDLPAVQMVQSPTLANPTPQPKDYQDLKPNEYKLLQALIFLEIHKNYELAMGLFAELMQVPEHRLEALYHYANTALGLGLNSEFRHYMIQVAQEAKDITWKKKSTEALVQNIKILEVSDIGLIDPLVKKFEIDATQKDDYQITRAKYYSEKGNLGEMEDALLFISEKSPRYPDALLLKALFNYRQGQLDTAITQLQELMKATDGDKKNNLRSIGAMTLARMQFQKSQYKDAFKTYLMVDKSNPLWLQAMVESAWTQILSQDYEGAAGNMFSLHTDFFKNAFSPESYVVRTVGYLNLCQYGDGVQVLSEMNRKYTPWKQKLAQYSSSHKQPQNYYDTVRTWLKNSDLKEVDGLPRSFIVELARHPSFMSVQKQINSYEDEAGKFNKIALTLVRKERELTAKQNEAAKEVAEAKKSLDKKKSDASAMASIQKAEQKRMSYSIQHHIAKKARLSIKDLRAQGLARIEKEKMVLRAQASTALQGRYQEMVAGLDKVLDQNEILKYEVYSGAGEHIRYQMAGGDINEKERPELKVEKEKSLNWKFKGEIWEDEVGHYRSSLKNVCPEESKDSSLAELGK